MKNKNLITGILISALGLMLMACGTSELKIKEVEEARNLMIQAKQAAELTYLDITDPTNGSALVELAEKEAEIEAVDLKKLKEDELDALLPQITELTEQYQSLGKEMSDVLTQETERKEEKAKHSWRDVYFINKTGLNLTKIVLHDLTTGSYSDNYIGEGVTLLDGYTLMGVSLDLYEGSSEWEFVVTDEGGTDHVLNCEDLSQLKESGTSLYLNYDPKTNEGSVAEQN